MQSRWALKKMEQRPHSIRRNTKHLDGQDRFVWWTLTETHVQHGTSFSYYDDDDDVDSKCISLNNDFWSVWCKTNRFALELGFPVSLKIKCMLLFAFPILRSVLLIKRSRDKNPFIFVRGRLFPSHNAWASIVKWIERIVRHVVKFTGP